MTNVETECVWYGRFDAVSKAHKEHVLLLCHLAFSLAIIIAVLCLVANRSYRSELLATVGILQALTDIGAGLCFVLLHNEDVGGMIMVLFYNKNQLHVVEI